MASADGGPAEDLERLVPETAPPDLVAEHVARYEFATQFVEGRTVLDCACGSGYGSAILAERAGRVFGLDLQGEALAQAAARRPDASFWLTQGDVLSLPFSQEAFDAVVCFETLEHVAEPAQALAEMRRVLRTDGGLLILSTPNRAIYRDQLGIQNPYHVHEPTLGELEAMLAERFPQYRILGQRWNQGVLIGSAGSVAVRSGHDGATSEAAAGRAALEQADYFIAVCGSAELPMVEDLLYVPEAGNVMLERTRWAQRLEGEMQERTRWAQGLESELQERTGWAQRLEGEMLERTRWAQRLEEEASDLRKQRGELVKLNQDLSTELDAQRGQHEELRGRHEHLRLVHEDLLARHFLVLTPRAIVAAIRRRIRRLRAGG